MVVHVASRAAKRLVIPTIFYSKTPLLCHQGAQVAVKRQETFSTTKPAATVAQNRIFDSIRDPASLQSLLLLSSSSRTPLITFWKTSWCSSCASVAPLIHSLISSGLTPSAGGEGNSVGYAEVELDAPDMMEMGQRYSISSVPTLMAFDRQEAQLLTRVTDVNKLKDEAFLREWIDSEASKGGTGGAGGSLFGSLKGLFGSGA